MKQIWNSSKNILILENNLSDYTTFFGDSHLDIPDVVTLALIGKEKIPTTFHGYPLKVALQKLLDEGAACVDVNCARGPNTMIPLIRHLKQEVKVILSCYVTSTYMYFDLRLHLMYKRRKKMLAYIYAAIALLLSYSWKLKWIDEDSVVLGQWEEQWLLTSYLIGHVC